MGERRSGRSRPSTAEYLRHLLADVERYRSQWRVHVRHAVDGSVHQRAVAQVIAEHLWETGQVDDALTDTPRRLRDRVSRALSGELLSVETLMWFTGAFDFSDSHSRAVWDRYRDDISAAAPPLAATEVRRPMPASTYRTRSLDEYHQLGPDRLPAAHETLQVIEAVEETPRYSFQFDTASASVEVLRGGQRGPTYPNPDHPGIHVVDIVLPAPLKSGQTTVLGYRTVFRYEKPPPSEFRRVFRQPVRTVAMEVRFHPSCLPARLWWCNWRALDQPPTDREALTLTEDGRAHRLIEYARESIVGFIWEWS